MLPRSGSGTAPQSAGARAGPGPPAPGRAGPGSGPPAPQVLAPGQAVPVPGPLAAASGLQQFYQCCACNELFSSAKNVRIHFALMQAASCGRRSTCRGPGPGPTVTPPAAVTVQRVRQSARASDALKAAHSGMQVCQWQVVQINPAARALALGGRRGTGAGAAGGAWITPAVCPPGPGPGSGAAAAGAGRQPAEDGGAAGAPRETDTDSEMLDGPGGRGGSPAPDDPGTTCTILKQYCKHIVQ